MSAIGFLHKTLSNALPTMHTKRLAALCEAVKSSLMGAKVSITDLGRHVTGSAHTKHKIKRMDRLVGNEHIAYERESVYGVIASLLLKNIARPIILIDWSELCPNQEHHVLRAALAVGGRALTLFEMVYPRTLLGNRKVQIDFLNKLSSFLSENQIPIIVADAGFRVPFYQAVELKRWHWVGRIRNRDYISFINENRFFSALSLYSRANIKARFLGEIQWTQTKALGALLVLVKAVKKIRVHKTKLNTKSQSAHSKKQAKREAEPLLLVYSRSLSLLSAQKIVSVYQTRMQIEENFRDTKSDGLGVGVSNANRVTLQRRSILLLIAALTQFILWMTGQQIKESEIEKRFRVNSRSKTPSYSVIFLARQLYKLGIIILDFMSLEKCNATLDRVKNYQDSVLLT